MTLVHSLPLTAVLRIATISIVVAFTTLSAIAQTPDLSGDPITRFLQNRGQVIDTRGAARPDILYTGGGPGVRLYLRRTGISYVFYTIEHDSTLPSKLFPPEMEIPSEQRALMGQMGDPSQAILEGHRVDMELVGANPNAQIEQAGPSRDRVNFYLPQCPDGITDLPKFSTVTYRNIYPKIDLVLHGTATGMKYDFVVHPGGNVSQIRLKYSGAEGIGTTSDGGVEITSTLGNLLEGRPFSYQMARDQGSSGDRKLEIVSGYRLQGDEITFRIGNYDRTRTLVVDPTLIWGTYYGGSSWDYGYGYGGGGGGWGGIGQGMAVDLNGNITTDGGTYSNDFPVTTGAFQMALSGNIDGFLLSFNADGTRRWATYIGGSNWDYASGLGVDSLGSVSISLITTSLNFPVTPGAIQSTLAGQYDVAIARFDSSGRRRWSTYYGSTNYEYGGGLAVDRWGNIAFCGYTWSSTFPVTAGAFQTTFGGLYDVFLVKLDSSGNRRWSTFVGGTGYDWGGSVGFDSSGNVALTGSTYSPNFPVTAGAFQAALSPGVGNPYDVFLITFDSLGRRNWGTYFGGGGYDWNGGLGVDIAGNVYIGGATYSIDFPVTAGAVQPSLAGGTYDCFFSKFSSTGRLIWSTYYGGSSYDVSTGIGVAPNGHLYFIGYAGSADALKTANNYQANIRGVYDCVVGEFDSTGAIIWDSFYGGTQYDWGNGISGDGVGSVYISGYTNSLDLPTRRAFQPALNMNGGNTSYFYDAFVARFCNALYPDVVPDGPTSFCDGDSVLIQAPPGYDKYLWNPTTDTTRRITVRTTGNYSVRVDDTLGCNGTSPALRVVVHPLPRPRVQVVGPTTICEGDTVIFRIRYPGARDLLWTTGATGDSIIVTRAGTYGVRVTDSNGCIASSPTELVIVNPVPKRPTIKPGKTIWVCPDSTAIVNIGSSYYRTEWNNGSLTPTINVGEGTYWARVYNEQGCSAWSDTIAVKRYPRNKPTIKPLGSLIICPGDSVLLDAGVGYAKYRWSTGDSTRIIAGRLEGTVKVTITDTNGCQFTSDPIKITVFAAALVSITPLGKKTFCEGDSLRLDGGTGMFASYRWSTGDTTPRITVRKSGRYKVTVTTFDGCTGGADSINVTVNPRPVAAITGPTTVCAGSKQNYSVPLVAGYTYDWTIGGDGAAQGPVNTNTVVVKWGLNGPATVRVVVTNPTTGCSATATATVTLGSELIPVVTAPRQEVCPGDSVQLDAGSGYVSYLWSNGATSRRIYGRAGNSYTVTVRDADGCFGTSLPIAITEAPQPKPFVQPLGPTDLCSGDSVVLEGGIGWASYLWSNGDTTEQIVVRISGSYTLRVSDTLGCIGTSSPVDVTVGVRPAPVINGPVEVCKNSDATYSVEDHPGAGYRWTLTGGTLVSGQGTSQIVVTWGGAGGGTVQCDETSATSSCLGQSPTLTVTIGTQLKPTITFGGKLGFCPGDSLILDAGAGYASYLWSTGATSRRLTVRQSGAYSVTVADAGGCSGGSGDVLLREFTPPVPTVRVLGPTTIQDGDSVALEVVELYPSYQWTTGARTRKITAKKSGDYFVTVTDSNGCKGTSLGGATITVVPRTNIDTVLAEVEVGTVSASPGERVIVPLHYSASNLDTTYAKGYRGELRYNKTLLLPTGATPTGTVDGLDRVIAFGGSFPSGITTGGDLVQLEFIAMLGNAETAPLRLTSFELVGAPVAATITDGEFRLTGLCRNGGTRLANSDGSFGLKSVRPNPTNGVCEVEYEVVESGMTRLYVVDLLGRRVMELQSGSIDPGRYVVGFEAGVLGSGTYNIILETPTQRRSGALQVVR